MPFVVPSQVSIQTLGTIKVLAVVALTNPAAPALATELNAGTTVELTCALANDGFKPTVTQGKTTKKRRLCATSDTEFLQPALFSGDPLIYSVGSPQAPDANITALMAAGAKLYIVERRGLDTNTALATAQKSVAHYIQLGEPQDMFDPSQDADEYWVRQEFVYVNGSAPVKGTIAT